MHHGTFKRRKKREKIEEFCFLRRNQLTIRICYNTMRIINNKMKI